MLNTIFSAARQGKKERGGDFFSSRRGDIALHSKAR
jgi:hypothetical protein